MNLADIKTYVESHLTAAEVSLKDDFARVVAWVENKQATEAAMVAAEISDLTARGYTVTPPANQA